MNKQYDSNGKDLSLDLPSSESLILDEITQETKRPIQPYDPKPMHRCVGEFTYRNFGINE